MNKTFFRFISCYTNKNGNGRLTRTLTDMLLARADGSSQRFYSMSAAVLRDIQDLVDKGILRRTEEGGRSTYYELIEE